MNIGLDLRLVIEGLAGPVEWGEKELLQQYFSTKPRTYLIENIVKPIWLKN